MIASYLKFAWRHLFQVMNHFHETNEVSTGDDNSIVLGEALVKEIPEINAAVTTTPPAWFRQFNINNGSTALKAKGNFVGPEFFKVFPYKLLQVQFYNLGRMVKDFTTTPCMNPFTFLYFVLCPKR